MAMSPRSAIFLDKDGTLVEDVPFNTDPSRLRLVPGAALGLRRMSELGYRLFVVSNQSGLAFGRFSLASLHIVWQQLRHLLALQGVVLDGFYYCPHHPAASVPAYRQHCACRKPAPGMILRAAVEHRLHLARSWMVGDILDDIESGHRAGCRAALVVQGGETEWRYSAERIPDIIAPRLDEALARIGPP